MKKIKANVVVLTILCLVLCGNLSAFDFEQDGIYYNVTDTAVPCKVEVTSGTLLYEGHVTIPSVVFANSRQYQVTSIGEKAFMNCKDLKSVVMPNSIVSIGELALASSGITSLNIPASVRSIGNNAFTSCLALDTVWFNADSCTFMGNNFYVPVFYGCSGFKRLIVGNNVKCIPMNAFAYCTSLLTVEMGESLAEIGPESFYACSSLVSFRFPRSLKKVGNRAFNECVSLCEVFFEADSCYDMSDNNTYPVFYGCPALKRIDIGSHAKVIPPLAFSRCSGLTMVTIPKWVKMIGKSAFDYCENLDTLYYYADSCVMGYSFNASGAIFPGPTFFGCSALKHLFIGDNVKIIPECAFQYCSIDSVSLSENIVYIGKNAFTNSKLVTVAIPFKVSYIGDNAFYGCYNLTSVEYNAERCAYMGTEKREVFAGCNKLGCVIIGSTVKTLPDYAFAASYIDSVVIPPSVEKIGKYAFSGCGNLSRVNIPNTVQLLDTGAFNGCVRLSAVTLADNFNKLYYATFKKCQNLKYVNIGTGMSEMENDVFASCGKLSQLTIGEEVPPVITGSTFTGVDKQILIVVPCNAVSSYRGASYWNDFSNYTDFRFQISCMSNNEKWGTVELVDTPSCANQGVALIEAHANTGYHFVRWDDGDTLNPRSLQLTQNTVLTAVFEINHGVSDYDWEKIKVYSVESGVMVSGVVRETVCVTDVSGKRVAEVQADGDCVIQIPCSGLYFVKVGSRKVYKVAVTK